MNKIFITGDIHGGNGKGLTKLLRFHEATKFDKTDVIIVAGDWGYIFHNNTEMQQCFENDAKKMLNDYGMTYFIVLGNHENYDRIEQLPTKRMFGGVVRYEPQFENIVYFCSGYYDINGKNFWVLNGGLSSDKKYRIPHETWWEQEVPSDEQLKSYFEKFRSGNPKSIDYVVTHTCPLNLMPCDKYSRCSHPTAPNENLEKILQKVWDSLIKTNRKFEWYCGHFHLDEKRELRFLYNDICELE